MSISRFWFLRKDSGAEYGPVAESVLADWARAGRVAPEDFVSADRVDWIAAPDLAALGMVWMLELPDGTSYGPAHRNAFEAMLADGALQPPIRLRNAQTGESLTVGAEPEPAPAQPAANTEVAAPAVEVDTTPAHKGDTQRIAAEAAMDELAVAESETAPISSAEPAAAIEPASIETPAAAGQSAPELPLVYDEPLPPPPPEETAAASPAPPAEPEAPPPVDAGPAPADTARGAPAAEAPAAVSVPEPEKTLTWQAIARERDHFEREAARWKAMFEKEAQAAEALSRRIEELTASSERDRVAGDAERDDLRRRVAELERELDHAARRADVADARLVESYHELVRNYDILTTQFAAKNDELRQAQEEAAALRRDRDVQVQMLEEQARRDQTAAEQARRRLAEIEQAHLELLKSYREMNDRFIRMRDAAGPSAPNGGSPAQGETGEPSSGPRVRLWR